MSSHRAARRRAERARERAVRLGLTDAVQASVGTNLEHVIPIIRETWARLLTETDGARDATPRLDVYGPDELLAGVGVRATGDLVEGLERLDRYQLPDHREFVKRIESPSGEVFLVVAAVTIRTSPRTG